MKSNLNKKLAISAGIGVLIGILVLSYANNNNFTKLGNAEVHEDLSLLANEILTTNEISNKGVLNSLASKIMAANRALDKEDTETAIQKLNELIAQVTDQTGKHIPAEEASVLIGFAEGAINNIDDANTIVCDPMCIYELCKDMPPELKAQCEIDACSPGGACYP